MFVLFIKNVETLPVNVEYLVKGVVPSNISYEQYSLQETMDYLIKDLGLINKAWLSAFSVNMSTRYKLSWIVLLFKAQICFGRYQAILSPPGLFFYRNFYYCHQCQQEDKHEQGLSFQT